MRKFAIAGIGILSLGAVACAPVEEDPYTIDTDGDLVTDGFEIDVHRTLASGPLV